MTLIHRIRLMTDEIVWRNCMHPLGGQGYVFLIGKRSMESYSRAFEV